MKDDATRRYGKSPAVLGGEEVLEPGPYIRGCVRANHPISTSKEFVTTACWSFQSARSVVSRLRSPSVVVDTPTRRGVNGWASGPLQLHALLIPLPFSFNGSSIKDSGVV